MTNSKPEVVPYINWGRGRLLPYESRISIVAKFSILNHRSVQQSHSFIGEYWEPTKLAGLLNEDLNITETIFEDLDLLTCFGGEGRNHGVSHLMSAGAHLFSYCPTCLEMGFHATFHNFKWLLKCPIHHENLISKRYGIYASDRVGLIEDFITLMTNVFMNWLSIDANLAAHQLALHPKFSAFKTWVQTARSKSIAYESNVICAVAGDDYSINTLDQFWPRFFWMHSTSAEIRKILKRTCSAIAPMYRKLDKQSTTELKQLTKHFHFSEISAFYRYLTMLRDRMPSFREEAFSLLDDMRDKHKVCRCKWRKDHKGYWLKVNKKYEYYFNRCPGKLFANALEREWCNFHAGDPVPSYTKRMAKLRYLLFDYGFLKGYIPRQQFLISEELANFLDELMNIQLRESKDDLHNWEKRIKAGNHPLHCRHTLARTLLFQNDDESYMLSW